MATLGTGLSGQCPFIGAFDLSPEKRASVHVLEQRCFLKQQEIWAFFSDTPGVAAPQASENALARVQSIFAV
jgi:hypothetical protein